MHHYAAFASELKFVLDEDTAAGVREWARKELAADPHATGVEGDTYRTTSLYFDTDKFDLFFERGSYARAKFRIRRYNDGPIVYFERKLKVDGRLSKRRSDGTLDDLSRLASEGEDWSGWWFARRLQLRRLHPVCQISYNRTARVGMSQTGPLRLTMDQQVRAVASDAMTFTNLPEAEILPQTILELKYRLNVPTLFKRLIEEFRLKPRRISKYRLTARVLDLAGEKEDKAKALTNA